MSMSKVSAITIFLLLTNSYRIYDIIIRHYLAIVYRNSEINLLY